MKRRADDYGKRGEQTRLRILDAAFRLIGCAKGLTLRVEDVCSATPISRAAFYHYFASIEELLAALSVELNHAFNEGVLEAVGKMRSSAERADAGIRYYLEKAIADSAWGWTMVHISAAGPMFGAETAEAALKTIEDGIQAGEFDLPNARIGRDLLQGSVYCAIRARLEGEAAASEPADVARLILRALGVPSAVAEKVVARPLPSIDET